MIEPESCNIRLQMAKIMEWRFYIYCKSTINNHLETSVLKLVIWSIIISSSKKKILKYYLRWFPVLEKWVHLLCGGKVIVIFIKKSNGGTLHRGRNQEYHVFWINDSSIGDFCFALYQEQGAFTCIMSLAWPSSKRGTVRNLWMGNYYRKLT